MGKNAGRREEDGPTEGFDRLEVLAEAPASCDATLEGCEPASLARRAAGLGWPPRIPSESLCTSIQGAIQRRDSTKRFNGALAHLVELATSFPVASRFEPCQLEQF
jgi:hypothetical protein